MKHKLFYFFFFSFFFLFVPISTIFALSPGTLLYRTSSNGLMYGYSSRYLLEIKGQILTHIYPGHVGIYVGEENGEHYVVEALATGVVKTPAKYFVNEEEGEIFLGAKIPKTASSEQLYKAVKIAKNLAKSNPGYDFDFRHQKGIEDGDWTCVGLVERIYESANIDNPSNLRSLETNPDYYAVDITPDGFDNYSFINEEGDCFSTKKEFSMIAPRKETMLPMPEVLGYNAGYEYDGKRYFFVPYTQFLQNTLKTVPVDIEISSAFKDKEVRGKTPVVSLMLRWSLINNPISSVRNLFREAKELASSMGEKIFGSSEDELVLNELNLEDTSLISNSDNEGSVIINTSSLEQATDKVGKIDLEAVATDNIHSQESKIKKAEVNIVSINENSKDEASNSKDDNKKESAFIEKNSESNADYSQSENISILINQSEDREDDNDKKQEGVNKQISNESKFINMANSKVVEGSKPEEATNPLEKTSVVEQSLPPSVLVSKVYATGMNDFIELYNPNDFSFDLLEAGIRVEKTKTADNPSIAMRIGNESDGIYPGGTNIDAQGYYLIVRDDASQYFLDMADAIAFRSEFGWSGDAYTLYLGKGAISSSQDEDILDALGFGGAKYFRGLGTANEIPDNYYLNRIGQAGDNSLDFNLLPSADPSITWDDYINDEEEEEENNNNEEESEENDEEENNNNDDNNGNNDNQGDNDTNEDGPNSALYPWNNAIDVQGIQELWNFDDCSNQYSSVGRFSCALEIGGNWGSFSPNLSAPIDVNNFSISFYYRNSKLNINSSPRLNIQFKNEQDQWLGVMLYTPFLQLDNLPNTAWRYRDAPVFLDSNEAWHHFVLSVNTDESHWSVYFDGEEYIKQDFSQSLPDDFSILEISGDSGSVAIDELAVWNRALNGEEIASFWQQAAPLAPAYVRVEQKEPELVYQWDFNEGYEKVNEGGGQLAEDELSALAMNIAGNKWIWRNSENTALTSAWGKDMKVNFTQALDSKDMSLAFWWRSEVSPDMGRSLISLNQGDRKQFGLVPSLHRRGFYFNGNYYIFSEGYDSDIPNDNNWHHFALVYDSYKYQLNFFVDGVKKHSRPFIYLKDGFEPDNLVISSELEKVEIDDLYIYSGALDEIEVFNLYKNTKIEEN